MTVDAMETVSQAGGDPVWMRNARRLHGILRIELRRSLFGKRAALNYLLALLPVGLLIAMVALPFSAKRLVDPAAASVVYAGIFEGLLLRTSVFFGCAWIFMNLFRGDMVDRSLHYYFLSAIRRDHLVIGKYISGMIASSTLFVTATILTAALMYVPRGLSATIEHLFLGPGLKNAVMYIVIAILACIGYGAFFVLVGLLFRNPVLPALGLFGWEWVNFLLPPILKKISVVHYLQSLSPVHFDEGPFAIVADPTPAIIAIPTMIAVVVVCVLLACWRARYMEVTYAGE